MKSTGNPQLDQRLQVLADDMQASMADTCQHTLDRLADYAAVVRALDTVYRATPPTAPPVSEEA